MYEKEHNYDIDSHYYRSNKIDVDIFLSTLSKKEIYYMADGLFNPEILSFLKNTAKYESIMFTYEYITLDLVSIRMKYFINLDELMSIRNNLNKHDLNSIIRYME